MYAVHFRYITCILYTTALLYFSKNIDLECYVIVLANLSLFEELEKGLHADILLIRVNLLVTR